MILIPSLERWFQLTLYFNKKFIEDRYFDFEWNELFQYILVFNSLVHYFYV